MPRINLTLRETSEVTAVDWAVTGCEGRAECGRQCHAIPDAMSPWPHLHQILPYLSVGEEKEMMQSFFLCLTLATLGLSFGSLQLLCAVPESWNSHKHHLTGWLSQFAAAFHHQNFAKQQLDLGHYFNSLYQDKALRCTKTALGLSSTLKKDTALGRLVQ